MASQAIKEYDDFAGTNGYLIVDGLDDQTPGGKKLLSELGGSNVPNYPTDVATSDTKRYNLTVSNKAGDFKVGWEDEAYYDVANNGGLAKASGGDTISFSIDTKKAHDGDVLTYHKNGSTDEVVWAAPGGGGGDSQIEYLDLTVEWINDQYHLTAATKTLAEMSTLIQSGKQVIARVVKRAGSVITNITQIFIGDFYNGSPNNDGSAIWFGPGGSGSAPDNTHYVTVTSLPGSTKWWSDLWGVSDIDE